VAATKDRQIYRSPRGVRWSTAGTRPTAVQPARSGQLRGAHIGASAAGEVRDLCAIEKEDDLPTRRRLKGRTIAALAADGFEKVELVVPMRALQAAGATVDVVSLRRGRIRGVNLHMPASRVRVDKTVGEADPTDYDGLLLPGGFINPDLLRQSAPAREFVRAFAARDRGCSHRRDSWTDGPSPPGPGSATIW
jgi:hypothetical protein